MEELFDELRRLGTQPVRYTRHPPEEILRSYLRARLSEQLRPPEEVLALLQSEEPTQWGGSEMGIHVRTCPQCAEKIARLREERGHHSNLVRLDALGRFFASNWVYQVHARAYVTAIGVFAVVTLLAALMPSELSWMPEELRSGSEGLQRLINSPESSPSWVSFLVMGLTVMVPWGLLVLLHRLVSRPSSRSSVSR